MRYFVLKVDTPIPPRSYGQWGTVNPKTGEMGYNSLAFDREAKIGGLNISEGLRKCLRAQVRLVKEHPDWSTFAISEITENGHFLRDIILWGDK